MPKSVTCARYPSLPIMHTEWGMLDERLRPEGATHAHPNPNAGASLLNGSGDVERDVIFCSGRLTASMSGGTLPDPTDKPLGQEDDNPVPGVDY